jgi:hypothetical protein
MSILARIGDAVEEQAGSAWHVLNGVDVVLVAGGEFTMKIDSELIGGGGS